MLLIPTVVHISPGKGLGLFSVGPVQEWAVVYIDEPLFCKSYSEQEYESLPAAGKEFLDTYSNFKDGQYHVCLDNARFWNHSDKPNCGYVSETEVVALRDINIGEELTINYRGGQ